MSRSSAYRADFAKQAKKLCELGATDPDLAEAFGVSLRTIFTWKAKHADFVKALKVGKADADDRVKRSLYQRAVGYSHDDVHISTHQGQVIVTPIVKHYPPDTVACIFWLKNRDRENWRDRHEHTGADGGPMLVKVDTGIER